MTPTFKMTFDGRDITAKIKPHLVSLTLSDNRGRDADDLSFTVEDIEGRVDLPKAGSKIKVWLGYLETGLFFKGLFVIDELESSGGPDHINVKAQSTDFTAGIKVKKETFFEDKSVADIVAFIAGENDLKHNIAAGVGAHMMTHRVQTNESDFNFLTRMAKDVGAYFAIKNETIIFATEGHSETASGQALPAAAIDRKDTAPGYRFTERSRENKFTGAKAAWYNFGLSEKLWEVAGSEDRVKALSPVFSGLETARLAAKAEWDRLKRGELSMSITLPVGDPSLIPDQPVTVSGFKPIINAVPWIIMSVNHTLGGQALATDIELENKAD